MSVLGIDVSHHNGSIDWPSVARSQVRFAFSKATEGSSFVDPRFGSNWSGIRDAGILRGAYHFGRPASDPEAQAAHFASVIGPLSWGELPPALDLEVMEGQSTQNVVDWTLAFVARAEALIGCPVVPAPWKRWSFWQFTDGRSGSVVDVPGVSGPCDCDWFDGSLADLQALSDGLGATPAPQVAPAAPSGDAWPGRLFVWPSTPAVRGADVRSWQTRMAARGFATTIDGIYGPESKAACVAFQRHVGLDPDGIVGRRTWEATFNEEVS
ncbi:MAG TPA: GH25 family lysozyme [Polyangia bacterium]|jgi:lysozyme|nr:GH25 family lysozyme [Polyangia bacterium]